MDLSKYPLEKLLYFVAGILPGFVALWIYQLVVPGSFNWFFLSAFLGYKTKLGLATLAAFVAGNTITQILSSLLGSIGGAIGGFSAKPPQLYEVAPWRDPTWRATVSRVLGKSAPRDRQLMTKWLYDLRVQNVGLLPQEEQIYAKVQVDSEKLDTERDDLEWARWYEHYHQMVLQPSDRDVVFHVQRNLRFNLEAASAYVLLSALFVPAVRHWWAMLPAGFWVFLLIVEEWMGMTKMANKYSSFSRQITYLTELARVSGSLENV